MNPSHSAPVTSESVHGLQQLPLLCLVRVVRYFVEELWDAEWWYTL